MQQQHAPVLDYLLSTLQAHRTSGRIHRDVSAGLEAYMRHVMRHADERSMTGVEAMTACNRALALGLSLPQVTEDRHDAR